MLALSVDRAVITFGDALRNELESVKAKTDQQREVKRRQILVRWIPALVTKEPMYKDPAEAMRRR